MSYSHTTCRRGTDTHIPPSKHPPPGRAFRLRQPRPGADTISRHNPGGRRGRHPAHRVQDRRSTNAREITERKQSFDALFRVVVCIQANTRAGWIHVEVNVNGAAAPVGGLDCNESSCRHGNLPGLKCDSRGQCGGRKPVCHVFPIAAAGVNDRCADIQGDQDDRKNLCCIHVLSSKRDRISPSQDTVSFLRKDVSSICGNGGEIFILPAGHYQLNGNMPKSLILVVSLLKSDRGGICRSPRIPPPGLKSF